ncbi:hypothetical protein PR202_gb24119 [Eleusine coracana subsp. coracana]|uniref:Uncharacterized protein n=1 Tax=Eleusine coracana subsp. coracana TaxID=191504 RepID=A0AAV5FKL4_ELECO|nr:hypothetical protein QOZ80_5BG0444570 [Eleusine coracana subsp. coracana]GJN35359.1 hypothetical protein PR202_gb24119 [Eleusine coracana subsp. coracana]
MGNTKKLLQFLRPDPAVAAAKTPPSSSDSDDAYSPPTSPSTSTSAPTSPSPSPYAMSPWTQLPGLGGAFESDQQQHSTKTTGLLGSLVKADGHVYSLAASGDLLYTGTDSRAVRVWRHRRDLGGFRSGSGLVKAIVVGPDGRIFTGHQDGKIRVWRLSSSPDDSVNHRRVGSLPRVRDVVASSLLPSRYVSTRRKRSALWLRHFDAVSCLSLDAAAGLLYSGSWDRTVKVWRVSDSRCLESVHAHDDAVNAVAAAGFDALLLTGSADGTVKVWRREVVGTKGRTKHGLERVLRQGDGAVTAVAVAAEARVVYVGSSDGAVAHWQFPRCGGGKKPPRNGGAMWGHGKMAVLCVAVAGRVVVSGAADRTVCVWRREEGAHHARIAVLRGHAGPVKCVAIDEEEDGEEQRWVVYSGSLDGSVKVWRVSDNGGGSPGMMMTPARTPNAHGLLIRKGRTPPSPLVARSWTPYAAAPEPKTMDAV